MRSPREGIAEIGRLRKLSPESRIMALSDTEDEQEAFTAIMAGAQGYRSKQDIDPSEIMLLVHRQQGQIRGHKGPFVVTHITGVGFSGHHVTILPCILC